MLTFSSLQAPRELVIELSFRYISLFEAITGSAFPFERASEEDHAAGLRRGIEGLATAEATRVAILFDREHDSLAMCALSSSLMTDSVGGGVALEPYHVEPAAQPLHLIEIARALSRENRAGLPTIVVVVSSGRVDHVSALVRAQSGLTVILLLAETPASRGGAGLSIAEQASCVDASGNGVLVTTSTSGCASAVRAILASTASAKKK